MKLFGTDGIRGRAGEGPLAPERVRRLGKVIGHLLKKSPAMFRTPIPQHFKTLRRIPSSNIVGKDKVLIGRDPRASGLQIEEELIAGMLNFGIEVRRAGVLPTPGIAHLTRKWGCPLGIVISASHNPAGDNGIKLISNEGLKVTDETERAIEELYAESTFDPKIRRAAGATESLVEDAHDETEEYLDDLIESVDLKPLEGMKIVVDCANGAMSEFGPRLLERVGARPVVIHASPDGANINRDCGAIHPDVVGQRLRQEGATLAIAFDGDGDRVLFVDEQGTLRDGDDFLFLAAGWMRANHRLDAQTVVGTGMTNYGLEQAFKRDGIRLVRAAVGDRYVAEEMLRTGAALGGEPSGHIINFHYGSTGDGLLTSLLLLKILADGEAPLSERAAGWTRLPQLIVNVPVREKPPLDQVAPVVEAIAAVKRGMEGRGRVIVRYSGTEPVCRIMVEGPDSNELKELARRISGVLEQQIGDQALRKR